MRWESFKRIGERGGGGGGGAEDKKKYRGGEIERERKRGREKKQTGEKIDNACIIDLKLEIDVKSGRYIW